jgi:hemoglobin
MAAANSAAPAGGLYAAIGAMDGCRRLSAAFHARAVADPVLRPVFPSQCRATTETFARFLAQLLGGPYEYSAGRRWLSLREAHLRFRIGQAESDAWLRQMRAALDETATAEPVRRSLLAFFEAAAPHVANRGSSPGLASPEPRVAPALVERWEEQRALEEVVAAARRGDAEGALALIDGETPRACGDRDPAALTGLLAMLLGSGRPALVDHVHRRVLGDPALAARRYLGARTLLHAAAGAGTLASVELLLGLGADPNGGDPSPICCLANERTAGGGDIVHALVRGGADVDAPGGRQRCTALHMAARRGNAEVTRALLDCGADVEARDRIGDTPLRRAVNLERTEVAALLVRSGADPNARGSRGLTPALAARTPAMRQLLGERPAAPC